ncbi:rhomboid family intramembrane serine protease [Dysgonomonas macrotermitis]|uniref:Membrane associated serine protease, rhomboid family n=1 Tax=Dysgonomonas macrotermitis TaxID=1346286 RepID=A0A1M5BJG0_9BACT|nr:rhomboid family intramembrane serine protease [Dysgonomonas macrotermitis]SHF42392.1 Membrane associated serine protease, rhomboid family [Dysgonomonas macrotermitis]
MSFIALALIAITCIVSIIGFNDRRFFSRYLFSTYGIQEMKQVDRLLTSAFLHGDFMHLFFNMLALYFFSDIIIHQFNNVTYLIIYFAAVLGGNLLTLWMFRRDSTYTAVGASGGVSGIIFAAIAIYPQMTMMIMPIPIPIPGWLFGIGYLAYSVYGMRSSLGNIGHAAHLGGAAIGLIIAIILYPATLQYNTIYIGLIVLPLIWLGYLAYKEK